MATMVYDQRTGEEDPAPHYSRLREYEYLGDVHLRVMDSRRALGLVAR